MGLFAMLYAVFPSVCHSKTPLCQANRFCKCRPKITTDQKFEACRKELRLIGLVASIDPERDLARSCKIPFACGQWAKRRFKGVHRGA